MNEKLIDAILRCFLGELSTAKVIWRSALIPLLKRATPQQIKMEERDYFYDYNLESLRVGLETLMFLSGRQYEPESALEVAMTISKRRKLFNSVNNGDRRATGRKTYQIENIYTERVYKTYCYGKRLYNQQQNRKQATFFDSKIAISEFLNKGIENSIRLELGVVEKSSGKGKIERIRIKF